MARIILLAKTHHGQGKFTVTGVFKYTKPVDGIGVAGTPTLREFTLPVEIDLTTATTKALRKTAILTALVPACAQIKAMIAADEAALAALTDNAAEFDVDGADDNGTDVGSV